MPTLRSAMPAVALVATLAPSPASAQPDFADTAYADDARQILDVFLPTRGRAPYPVVLYLHGGGWREGDKSEGLRVINVLRERGIAVAPMNYRYTQQDNFPAQIHDPKGAVRWLRAHQQELGIDGSRIAAWGYSAGGHLAALLATSGAEPDLEGHVGGDEGYAGAIRGAVSYAGYSDFETLYHWQQECTSSVSQLLGRCYGDILRNWNDPEWAEWRNRALQASPVTFVDRNDPPLLLVHGTHDGVVPIQQAYSLKSRMDAAGAPCTLRVLPGVQHVIPTSVDAYAADFLAGLLGTGPKRGDLDGDAAITPNDIDQFLLMYGSGDDDTSDINGDGVVDSDDFFDLVNQFTDSQNTEQGENR